MQVKYMYTVKHCSSVTLKLTLCNHIMHNHIACQEALKWSEAYNLWVRVCHPGNSYQQES